MTNSNSIDKGDLVQENGNHSQTRESTPNPGPERYKALSLRSPTAQILLISLICFCCPGIRNAISGLGGSGQLDSTAAANGNVALLASTAVSALILAPPVFDIFGPRPCLLVGGWTYALYSGSLLCYNHTENASFVIASAAMMGLGASLLWIAQGVIMVSYPIPEWKGRAIAMFWVVFNLGGAIGSFVSFGLNFHSSSGTVSDGTYGAFMAIMLIGWFLSVFVLPPHKVLRSDGTHAGPPPIEGAKTSPVVSLKREISNLVTSLSNWRIILLVPMFFYANFFYSYQENSVNGDTFTLRTRSLNGAMYWTAQMVGGLAIGFLLDLRHLKFPYLNLHLHLTRRTQARVGWTFVFVTGMAIWGGGLAFQMWNDKQDERLDFGDARTYIGPFWLYFLYGAFDSFWQSFCYWMMASLAKSPQEAAKFVGLYKAVQAAGGAVSWRINALHYPAMTQFVINWSLIGASMVVALPSVLSVTSLPLRGQVKEEGEARPE
ncbi:hypothetical protein PQX77_006231 [Marasmius sp. AFHP31]|nr:hypothetical protein PQX77_006231 [Marasmius sp. AFHP31]